MNKRREITIIYFWVFTIIGGMFGTYFLSLLIFIRATHKTTAPTTTDIPRALTTPTEMGTVD